MSASSRSSALIRRWQLLAVLRLAARFSRLRSAVSICTICRRRVTRSASCCVCSSGSGRGSGLVAAAKRAITAASIGSVLARLPRASAKARTCAGLITATGSLAAASPAATTVSNPPVASIATICGGQAANLRTSSSIPSALRATWNTSPSGSTCTSKHAFDTSIPATSPSDPDLAKPGSPGGPSDCPGWMEQRTGALAHPRA